MEGNIVIICKNIEVKSGPGRNRTAVSAMRMQCSTARLRAQELNYSKIPYLRTFKGFTCPPLEIISKWRWIPVERPVEPILPIAAPLFTV